MKIWTVLKELNRVVIYFSLALLIFQLYFFVSDYYNDRPECVGIRNALKQNCLEEKYNFNNKDVPPMLEKRIGLLSDLQTMIYITFGFVVLLLVFQYLENPKEHWFNKFKKDYKELKEDMQDE